MVLIAHLFQMPWGLHSPHSFFPFSNNLGPCAFVVPFKYFLCCKVCCPIAFLGVLLMRTILNCNLIFSGTNLWFPCILCDCAHVFHYDCLDMVVLMCSHCILMVKLWFNLARSGFKAFKIPLRFCSKFQKRSSFVKLKWNLKILNCFYEFRVKK